MPLTKAPSEIEQASAGEVTIADLRNYARDDRFNTPLEEPKAGKPRAFPIFAAYEALLLKRFHSCGVPLNVAKGWNKRILGSIAKNGLATVTESGTQYGPNNVYPVNAAPQIVLFHRDCAEPVLLTDSAANDTFNRAFYQLRRSSEKSGGPAETLCAIHLPALISNFNRGLGITHEDAGIA